MRYMNIKYIALLFSFLVFASVANADKQVTPEDGFMQSAVLLRPGIDDLRGVTVAIFVELVRNSKMDNGKSPQVKGWSKTSDGYALNVVGIKPYKLEFLWVGGDSSLLKPIKIGYDEIPAMMYVMTLGG